MPESPASASSSPTAPVLVIEDPTFLEHRSPDGHPERPQRLQAVGQALAAFEDSLERRAPRAARDEELLAIHARDHLRSIERAVAHAPAQLDPDTYVSARSEEVARLAAGSAIDLALA